jgi:hypothetical protein
VAGAAKSGALWGLGHGLVIAFGGGALILTGTVVPRPVALVLDLAVAVMLVGLGIAAFARSRRETARAHAHDHVHARRPLAVGLLHGASGTAALTLLVAATIASRSAAIAFVGMFALASILGMTLAAALLALSLRGAVGRAPGLAAGARVLAGIASVAAGAFVGWTSIAGGAG